MIRFLAFLVLRAAVVAFFALTSAYGVACYSPFAFDTFIRAQHFPVVNAFVAWHHIWYLGAFAVSVVTLVPELRSKSRDARVSTAIAHWLAVLYVVVFGAAGLWLLTSPYLPRLLNDRRSLVVGGLAYLPVLWLAVIDHVSAWARTDPATQDQRATGQRRLLDASLCAAIYLWGTHLARTLMHGQMDNPTPWVISSIWVLTLDLVLFVAIYSALSLIHALSDCAKRRRGAYLHVMTTGLVAAGIAEVCRRIIFPTISLGRVESAAVAAIMGTAIAATWAGIALRRPARRHAGVSGIDLLLTPTCRRSAAVALLIVLPLATGALLSGMARMDWDFVMQRLCVIVEFTIAYGLVLRLAEDAPSAQRWSQRLAVVPAVFALALVFGVPRATAAVAAMAGDRTLEPAVVLDRYAAAELSAKLIASQIVAKPGFDSEYLRYLQVHADVAGKMSITVPTAEVFEALPGSRPLTPAPDIFVFVVDSLRRDYVSPYNPAVTFTPNIARFASDSFVFQNAFTRYGGTELAMPSIWAGGPVVRKVQQAFHRINAVEKTLNRHGYRVAISDYTVARHLRPPTPITTLESGVSSAESDVCRFVEELEDHLDSSAADRRPVFGFSSPMNVHILNTRRGGQSSLDRDYPGFYSPYASRMKRVDACFGEFTAYLKRHNRYDNSIIVLTSDHGDSLGEDGNWGHAFWLFPEDVRIPLVVHIPEALKSQVTTDLARVAFSTDIAPTLSALLGDRVRRVNPLFGEPLFVPSQQTLSDRRRQSFLLVSSYGPTYGILRRNGRLLYISDLVDWHESAFDLTQQPIGSRVVVEDELRRVNQRLIRDGVAAVASFYSVRP